MTFPLMCLGGKGVISVVTNLAPSKMSTLTKHMLNGELDQARAIHFDIFELCQAMFLETNPIPVKAALGMMGKIKPEFRLPLCPLAEGNQAKLKAILEKYELI